MKEFFKAIKNKGRLERYDVFGISSRIKEGLLGKGGIPVRAPLSILVVLSIYRGSNSFASPSINRIVRDSGVGVNSVQKYFAMLEKLNFIKIKRGQYCNRNVYEFPEEKNDFLLPKSLVKSGVWAELPHATQTLYLALQARSYDCEHTFYEEDKNGEEPYFLKNYRSEYQPRYFNIELSSENCSHFRSVTIDKYIPKKIAQNLIMKDREFFRSMKRLEKYKCAFRVNLMTQSAAASNTYYPCILLPKEIPSIKTDTGWTPCPDIGAPF